MRRGGNMPKAVIFDIDGTLIDTVDLHAASWVETFQHFGVEVAHANVRAQIGKGADELMPVFLNADVLEKKGRDIERFRSDLFKRNYLVKARPFPCVRDLFKRIRTAGQTIVLASSCKADEIDRYKEIAGIADLIDAETTSDDAEHSKPHPDIFQAALGCIAPLGPDDAIAVGDTPYDAQAAASAGIRTVGVLCGGFPEADLSAAGCIRIYRDPEDLLQGYE